MNAFLNRNRPFRRKAPEIPVPSIFGKFKNEEAYIATVQLMIDSSQETWNRALFFRKKILPICKKNNFLDIGPGNGLITKLIGSKFKNVTCLDPNRNSLNSPFFRALR